MEAVAESETDGQLYYQELKEFLELDNGQSVEDLHDWATKKWGSDGVKCLARIKKRASHYCLLDGVLHHGKENPKPVVMFKSEQQKILQDLHVQEQTGIHNGVSKMYSALCAAYFWRGQYGDVKNFVEINLLGPYQLREKSVKFVAVLVDPVSHWLSAQICSVDDDFEQLSDDVSRFVFSTFCTLGFPSVLSLVEGCKLKRDIMCSKLESMMKKIKFSETQANGKVAINYDNPGVHDNNPPTLLSLTGITLEKEARVLLELNMTSASSCIWAWKLMENYVSENEDTWDIDLDIFLFEQRRKKTVSSNKCPFYHMYGRQAFIGDNLSQDKEIKPKRRKLKSSVFECRHCQESFTSKISFHIHQKKHTEEAQLRGLIDEDTNDEVSHLSSGELQHTTESTSSKLPSSDSNAEPLDEVSVSTSNSCQKSTHHRPPATSHRRKPHMKTSSGKKQYQRGITRLLNLAQISRSLAAKGVSDEIPKDSCRANFTAQTVASVRASLEAKRKKRISRGNYQRYSPELREEIAKYAISHGTQQAVQHFSSKLGGKPISESTVRNFIKAQCSPTSHHNCFRNQGLEEEIGRFSAVAGTEAAIRCFSSRLGREIKRGTVRRLRRAYINKHPEDAAVSKSFCKKKCDTAKRKRRFGAMLRDEIGSYAAQHGVAAAVQHFSERLLFPVRVLTVEKFLKLHTEKKASKNNLVPVEAVSDVIEKTSCIPTHVSPSLDILNPSLDVLGGLHQGTCIDRLDQGNSVSHLIYNEDGYGGLQHTLHDQQQSNNSLNPVNFHTSDVGFCSDEQHSTSQVILDQVIPVSFCSSQDLSFSSVQSYSSYEHASLQVSINSIGVEHSSGSVSLAIQSNQQGEPVSNVPISHVLSQHNNIIVGHSSLISSHDNTSDIHNTHQPIILPPNNESSEHVLSEEGQGLPTNHSVALTTLLPSSSFDHVKTRNVCSPLINPSSENTVPLNDPNIISLQKSVVQEIVTSLNSLSSATPQTFQVTNDATNKCGRDSVANETNAAVVSLNPQHIILEETLPNMPIILRGDQAHKSTHSENEEVSSDKRMLSEMPLGSHGNDASRDKEISVRNFRESDSSVPTCESNSVEVHEKAAENVDSSKGSSEKKKYRQSKKSKKVVQKPKRGTYTFYSPELRARIGRYAAEHGNLQASKYFQAEVGHQIPESTIRGLRDKYVMKQMQVAATAGSGGDCGVVQRQVTALGYAPRGRPMRLGKYDEIVQDCMHELVNSGEKACSMLAITTARQVLTQYEPSLLEEFGGQIKLNNSWAKSFLKRMGLSNNS
ncbi:hypothetical protein J437_LFUL005263 [Ladona fulva]|uniref:C2H2-type domain-containing protein n=1 Tax=Ladona fulva TaxID=123851 RepID=A0A8K0JVI1_LADFU|nr:hypothetical protein J437_LFUL005263 [Ladona fulva]